LAVWVKGHLIDQVIEVIVKLLGERHTIVLEDDVKPSHYWLTRKRGFSLTHAE